MSQSYYNVINNVACCFFSSANSDDYVTKVVKQSWGKNEFSIQFRNKKTPLITKAFYLTHKWTKLNFLDFLDRVMRFICVLYQQPLFSKVFFIPKLKAWEWEVYSLFYFEIYFEEKLFSAYTFPHWFRYKDKIFVLVPSKY